MKETEKSLTNCLTSVLKTWPMILQLACPSLQSRSMCTGTWPAGTVLSMLADLLSWQILGWLAQCLRVIIIDLAEEVRSILTVTWSYNLNLKGMLPVRWMSPESLADGIFTPMSDIWSYGVLMYEIITFGSFPFQGLSNNQVLENIKSGSTLTIPMGIKIQL